MAQKTHSYSKIIRRVIIALEIVILLAAFAAIRYVASLPKHYQIIYYNAFSDTGRLELFQPDTGHAAALIETTQDGAVPCDIELRVDDTFTNFNNRLARLNNAPVLFDFWSADAVEIVRHENRVILSTIRSGSTSAWQCVPSGTIDNHL